MTDNRTYRKYPYTMMKKAVSLALNPKRWKTSLDNWQKQQQLSKMARMVATHSNRKYSSADSEPAGSVIFFNASARLGAFSQNAAFSLLSSWGLRLAGLKVIHFVCESGLQPCVLGTNREDFSTPPPCTSCIALSTKIFKDAEVRSLKNQEYPDLEEQLQSLDVNSLCNFIYLPPPDDKKYRKYSSEFPAPGPIPLGQLVLPSVRWALRKHDLEDSTDHRYLLRQYILSAFNVIQQFDTLIHETSQNYRKYSSAPSCAVIFNGIMYPEAAARWISQQRKLRVITHEVGFQKFSAFFSHGDATAYPIDIPSDFDLDIKQNEQLNTYLENRFQGKFSMAGIQFWPEMRGLDQAFLEKAGQFRLADGTFRMVPIFTNVVYDTSQVHANVVFPHMFAWLDLLHQVIQDHPETLFVIRAHPDEMRPGTAKQSRQTVRAWVEDNALLQLPNVVYIDSLEYISSYELIQKAKFVIVYNSSIGLEAAVMGKPVLCGGKARFTQYPIVFFPLDTSAYRAQVEEFLNSETILFPEDFKRNARRFLYYQLYRASLPYGKYLETGQRAGFVHLQAFPWQDLFPERSITIQTLLNGVLHESEFLLPEEIRL